ncbi:MAG: hypothetical protein RLZZ387_3515 [Chloroflexota bacterium]|jgi:HPt (histidine-containing phosphotransfer) domain-containing protein
MTPINTQALETMIRTAGGDQAFFIEMIEAFLSDSQQLIADLEQSVTAGDTRLLERTAHSLKANSEIFGAMLLATITHMLEELGRRGELSGAAELVGQAATEYERVRVALAALAGAEAE